MKLAMISIGVLFFILAASVPEASACEITFNPAEVHVGPDGKGTVKILLKWEHRKCVLDDDDVHVDGKSVKILKSTGFKKVRRGRFENVVNFELQGKEGSIRVWRDCSLKGLSEGIVKIKKK